MSGKKDGRRLEDFLSPEEKKACDLAQEQGLPLLPALYKINDVLDRFNDIEQDHHSMKAQLKSNLTTTQLNEELKVIEGRFENRFDKLIRASLKTNSSINDLTSQIALLCQRFDGYTRELDRVETNQTNMGNSFRERFIKLEDKQGELEVKMATQSGSLTTAKSFIPTVLAITSIIGTIYMIFFRATG